MRRRLLLLPLLLLAACGDGSNRDRVSVVATTTQVGDLARAVAGERAGVDVLLRPGLDPHEFDPRPSDARAIAQADLVLRSGGEVDEWLSDLLEGAGGEARRVDLSESVRLRDGDPHWWQNPRNAVLAVESIADALTDADPDGAAGYRSRALAYRERLETLDRRIAACIGRLPRKRRLLVTTHDSLSYFAARYGLRLVGSLIPSRSSQAQPSAGEVDRLVRRIRELDVKAIFPESALSPELEQAVARESGAKVGSTLWTDALGPPRSDGATYLEATAANAAAILEGLSGGSDSCPDLR